MSISIERFASDRGYQTYDPYAVVPDRVEVFQVQCRCCGYEPENAVVPPKICPKCHSQSWERFARPGSILKNAERY